MSNTTDAASRFILHHQVLGGSGTSKTALVLHGALGSGQNFRGFVRKLMQLRSEYAFVLADLRCHGQSHPAPPPHTLAAAAGDIAVLVDALRSSHPHLPPVSTLIGHSLGGKVVLEVAAQDPELVSQVFVLDSNPGTQDPELAHEIHTVIKGVRAVAMPAGSRKDVVDALLARGFSSGLANWMTTNLQRHGDELTWTFALDAIEELLADYFRQDLWPFLEAPPAGLEVELVIAENSDRWSSPMRQRARKLDAPNLHVHEIPNAGHWLHVDNPQALLELMVARLLPSAW